MAHAMTADQTQGAEPGEVVQAHSRRGPRADYHGHALLRPNAGAAQPAQTQTQTRMRDYSDGEVWQTSGTWGRVRHRVGFEWTLAELYQVRAVSQFQVDWPTGCTVGASPSRFPVTVDGCSPKLLTKRARLDLRSLEIPMNWTGPNGSGSKACRWGTTGTESSDFTETWTCTGEWMPQQDYFRYSMSTSTLLADVKNDGDGLRDLDPLTDTVTFVQR